jgi:hypothetical protein
MSAKITGEVWELDLSHPQKWVLMAMADHADHDGGNVFPSVGLIAWKCGYSERQVQRIRRELEALGVLVLEAAPAGERRVYRIDLAAAPRKARRSDVPGKRPRQDVTTPRQDVTPDMVSPVTPGCQGRGDIQVSPGGDIQVSPKPPLTVKEPPPTRERATRGVGVAQGDQGSPDDDLVVVLDELGVASGPKARHRWRVQAERNRHANCDRDRLAVIRYAVRTARAAGKIVNYASDVQHLVAEWRPPAKASAAPAPPATSAVDQRRPFVSPVSEDRRRELREIEARARAS